MTRLIQVFSRVLRRCVRQHIGCSAGNGGNGRCTLHESHEGSCECGYCFETF